MLEKMSTLTLLQPLLMVVFVRIALVTYVRPSELLALGRNMSAVIADFETGCRQWTGVRGGSVLMDQRWLQWVNKEERIWNFDYVVRAKMFKAATETLGLSGMTMYQTSHSGTNIDRVRGFTVESVQRCRKIRQRAVVWQPTATPCLSRFETNRK